MKMKFINIVLLLLCPLLAMGQLQRSEAFKNQYKLKEVVILSRHNIRSSLSVNGSVLQKMTPHQWIKWSAAPSELTLRGGALETIMGQFFRKWTVNEGLFTENAVPTVDEVNFYANSMQRTIATAQYFSSGFMPVANLHINHRFTPSKMDPVFFPALTKSSEAFKVQALKEIAAMGGKKGIVGINEGLKDSYQLIEKVLDLKHSPACQSGEVCAFDDYNTQLKLEKGDEPNMKGSLKFANSASDALILQYYEDTDPVQAAFGQKLTNADWEKIAKVNVAHPLLVYMKDELNAKNRKFTFLCGHDSNIASVNAALEVEEYSLPQSIEKKTPIGSKLVFEKWVDKAGKEFVAVNIVYQTTEQLRNVSLLNLENPPVVFSLKLKGLQANADGLYTIESVNDRFDKAIRAYEAIK